MRWLGVRIQGRAVQANSPEDHLFRVCLETENICFKHVRFSFSQVVKILQIFKLEGIGIEIGCREGKG
jgi:hypothetical protein